MAKKGPSKHSRAARRATSPGIDTDKSLKNVKPPEESVNQRPAVLAAHHSGGITKKSKTGRAMSTRARRRHEKGIDRAEAVLDRTLNKIEKSKGQARTVQSRRKAWEEINTVVVVDADGKKTRRKKTAKELAEEKEQAEVDKFFRPDDGDEEMEEDEAAGPAPEPATELASKTHDDDDDEIL